MPDASVLCRDALGIWQAGVDAVRPEVLLPREVVVAGGQIAIGDWHAQLDQIGRIVVVGGGKAGASMAIGLESALGTDLLAKKRVTGWVNVPEGTIVPTQAVHLHAARPAAINEPRPAGVEGTRRILQLVSQMHPSDLCICLLSGGGSALLPAPTAGVTLEDKIAITQLLSAAGATIDQLNTVRRQLSDIKGGGLARACTAGTLVSVIVSDVLGDPLETIASGPTVQQWDPPQAALDVLRELDVVDHPDVARILPILQRRQPPSSRAAASGSEVHHVVIANNATAVDASGAQAERLGYEHSMICASNSEGPAEEVGRHLAHMALRMRDGNGPTCLISGGEPTVQLVTADRRGKGGRNQQLVLAALETLGSCEQIALLSGGTDGEDGPTDAAGAWVDAEVAAASLRHGLAPRDYLERNDAYHFFEPLDALLKTGPTGTNVCDVRVIVVQQSGD